MYKNKQFFYIIILLTVVLTYTYTYTISSFDYIVNAAMNFDDKASIYKENNLSTGETDLKLIIENLQFKKTAESTDTLKVLPDSGIITVITEVTNVSNEEKAVTMVITVYKKYESYLLSVQLGNFIVPANTYNLPISLDIKIDEIADYTINDCFAKAFVWNSVNGMIPLIENSIVLTNEITLLDTNNTGEITESNMETSTYVTKSGIYSGKWANQDSLTTIRVRNLPRDLTKFTQFEFWLYSDTNIKSTFQFNVMCDKATSVGDSYLGYQVEVDWSGWHKVTIPIDQMTIARSASLEQANYIVLSSVGWSQIPNSNAVLYFDNIKLKNIGNIDLFQALKVDLLEYIHDEITVYNNCNKVLKNGLQFPMAETETVKVLQINSLTYVPIEFFEKFLSIPLSENINVDKQIIGGITYVPLCECAALIGKNTITVEGLTFVTDKDNLSIITNNEEVIAKIKRYITYTDLKNMTLTENDYLQFENMWRFTLIGDEEQDRSNPYIDAQVSSYEDKSRNIQDMIIKDPSQPLYGEPITGKSEQIGTFYSRIRTMAIAYELESASTYHNAALKDDIIYALNWMYDNMYGPDTMEGGIYDNWYYFQVDGPICLLDSLIMMKNELTSVQISKYLEPVNYFVPDTVTLAIGGQIATGANKVCITYVAMCSAILERNIERYQDARDELLTVFKYVKKGDGFYTDGSFIQHGNVAYNGSYGVVLLKYLANLMLIISNSKFEITDPILQNQYNWIFDSFEPLIYKGSMMSMVMGRAVSRTVGENYYGAMFVRSALKMIEYTNNETVKSRLKSIIKYYVNNNTQVGMNTMTLPEISLLNAILSDAATPERQDYNINKTFYNMDRVVNQNDNFTFGLSMSSSRICSYEAMNQENMKGWYTGDGMTYLYIGNDTKQYDPQYWSLSNPYRRPGTTVDTQIRDEICLNSKPTKDFVGGVSQNMNGVAAMFLDSYSYSGTGTCRDANGNLIQIPQHTCTLEAQKSWFIFDDEIVALGAGIVSTDNVTVETIVENRKLSGSKALSINGEIITCVPGSEDTRSNVQYANIEGTGGYFFPTATQLKIKKTDTTPSFYEMWIDHGSNPSNAAYSYVLLPAKTINQTRAYSENPDIEIILNTNILQEVREKNLGVTGYVFWKSGAADIIQADMPCVVMVKEKDGKLNVSVSDPTHKLTGGRIVINKANLTVDSADEGLQIDTQSVQTAVQINFTAKPAGDTFNVTFSI